MRVTNIANSLESTISAMHTLPPYPSRAQEISSLGNASDLAFGIRELVVEGRLSANVVAHAHHISRNWEDVDLFSNSPFGGKTAANMEARERGWCLMLGAENNLADHILLIGLQHTLLDTSYAERLSQLYFPIVMRWTDSCTALLDEIDAGDISTTHLLIWVCTKLAGTMVATSLRMESASGKDPRFQMALKMMARFPNTRDWASLEAILRKFSPQIHCTDFWYILWRRLVSWSEVNIPSVQDRAGQETQNTV